MQIEQISLSETETQSPVCELVIDSIFFYYLSKELKLSRLYRRKFCKRHKSFKFSFILAPTRCDTIDYNWNDRVTTMAQERRELDHALSWLSTLGGAFSALGDYYINCAEIAGKISVNQLKLGLRLGDPSVASRCRLYFSLSLIQQQRFKLAKSIIYSEYKAAKSALVLDERLIKMCKGIWSKLQYESRINKTNKKFKKLHFK